MAVGTAAVVEHVMLSAHQRMSCSNRTSPLLRTRTTMSPLSRCSSMSTPHPVLRYTTRLFGFPFSTSCSAQTSVIWLAVGDVCSLWFPLQVKA